MEAVIFIGIQGSGKSTFYRERFFKTHVRINLDMLKSRHRERILLQACLDARQPFVVDNTNPTVEVRAVYVQAARAAGFQVIGYYFQSSLPDCLKRNDRREGEERIPEKGVVATYKRLQRPSLAEGFDRLFYVKLDERRGFMVEEWADLS